MNAVINYDSLASMVSFDSILLTNNAHNNFSFGNLIDLTNFINDTVNDVTEPIFQQSESGFLYFSYTGGSNLWVKIAVDSILNPEVPGLGSANVIPPIYLYADDGGENFEIIPIKKNHYWSMQKDPGLSFSKVIWIPIENTNLNSSSTLDSTTIANMIANYGSLGGCDFKFPEGLDVITAVNSNIGPNNNYTVPTNKRLYISSSSSPSIAINGLEVGLQGVTFLMCNSEDIISHPGTSNDVFHGFLVNANTSITAITSNIGPNNTYTVPSNKNLFISSAASSIYINDIAVALSGNYIVCNSGDIISHPTSNYVIHGYLADEDYFANCGGGNSSSTLSTIDSSMVAEMIASSGNSCDLKFPEGIGTPISKTLQASMTYTVPENKTLYITNEYFSQSGIRINGEFFNFNDINNPIIVNAGDVIGTYGNSNSYLVQFNGFLVDTNYFDNCNSLSSNSGSINSNMQMTVSTLGDTLTIGDQYVIIPGISYENFDPEFGSVTDIEGNTYQTFNYGIAGEWMIEDLIVSKFSNGDEIPQAIFNYNGGPLPNNMLAPSYYPEKLYNGFSILDNRNICPTGWHVPSLEEWELLLSIFGNYNEVENIWENAGTALKSDQEWSIIEYLANSSYFSVTPNGYIEWLTGGIHNLETMTRYWTSTFYSGGTTSDFSNNWIVFQNDYSYVSIGQYDAVGLANCRCIKD